MKDEGAGGDLDALPGLSAIRCLHQIGARILFTFQIVDIRFAEQPSILIVAEINVAQNIGRRLGFHLPTFAAVRSLQECASTAPRPAMVLIQKKNGVQPRQGSYSLA